MKDKRNVFISHYGRDDEHIGKLKRLMESRDISLRNSSIDSTKPNRATNDDYIRTLLRERIRWAGTTIVLIGPNTHKREWVDWEIEQSAKQGNNIVGVYIEGASDSDIPEAFERHGSALVGWQSGRVLDAIEGRCTNFESVDGSERAGRWKADRGDC